MNQEELKKLQDTQCAILKEVINVCDKNDIIYYVAYGTLLGAVRHKGTIPWDNDIDIMMTRNEFNRFVDVKSLLPSHLVIKYLETEDTNLVCEARVSNVKTLQYGINHQSQKGQVSIDIFVLDDQKEYKNSKIHSIISKYTDFLGLAMQSDFEKEWLYDLQKGSKLKTLALKLSDVFGNLYGRDNCYKRILSLRTCRNGISDYYRCALTVKPLLKSDFGKGVKLQYEDILVNAPENYDRILTDIYGNYMQLPPEEKRFTANLDDFVVEYLD